MRVAKIRNHFGNLAHTAVFPFISSLPDFVCGQTQCGPQFLEMLAKLVHGLAPFSGRTLCLFESRLNLLLKNSFQSASKRFTRFESVAHRFEKESLFRGQPQIAIAFFAGDFATEPRRWFKAPAGCVTWKFNFGDDQAVIFTAVNIDLDLVSFPRNLITDLA